MAHGEKVYAANCAACHQANGKGVPARSRRSTARKVVTGPSSAQIDIVLNGKTGTAMPPWKQLSRRRHRGGDHATRATAGATRPASIVQPAEVKAARK